jgi:ARP2/3 complex subunit p16-Arc
LLRTRGLPRLPPDYARIEGARIRASHANTIIIQEAHLQTVIEVLQSIKASDMTPMLQRIYSTPGGSECLDVLMKYL